MLEFEGEPEFLERYSVLFYGVVQKLGEVGFLNLTLHPLRFRSETELETHAYLQQMIGRDLTCSDGEWTFTGVVDSVETATQTGMFQLMVLDNLSKLEQTYNSRVFAEQTIEDIVGAVVGEELEFECFGCGSVQVKLAIQYQESNLAFLKRLLQGIGGQVWCDAGKICVGTQCSDHAVTLRLGRDVRNFVIRTGLGPEGVNVSSISYADGNAVEPGVVEAESGQFGDLQSDAIDRRQIHEQDSTLHVVHEDSSYEDTTHLGERFLRSRTLGRFYLHGTTNGPLPVGGAVTIENYNAAADEVTGTEEAIIRRLDGEGERNSPTGNWQFEAVNSSNLIEYENSTQDRLITSTAIVHDNDDPVSTNRVRVYFPWDPNECTTPWLRVTSPSWGDDHAHFMPPEIGDTVLVQWGLSGMDPVVIGCLAAGNELDLSDNKLVIQTVDGQTITIGDDSIKLRNEAGGGGTEVEILGDQTIVNTSGGQNVTISGDGIKLDSGTGSSIEVQSSKIVISAAEVEISSTGGGKISISGPTVSINNGALEVI